MISIAENKDCMAAMAEFPDKFFDLAIVDPPYGISINMNMGRKKGRPKKHENKKWDCATPDKKYFDELTRISKNQIVWGGNYFTDKLPPSMGWIAWDKEIPDGMSFSKFELAWSSFDVATKKFQMTSTRAYSIHPTQKPVALYKWLLQNYAKPGDKILDTHLGSGSSRIAAHDMGFDFWSYELDSDYFEKQEQRFKAHISKPVLFQPYEMYSTGTLF
jgi:site-specific DNA-methyltransferase (adenine-specific)